MLGVFLVALLSFLVANLFLPWVWAVVIAAICGWIYYKNEVENY